MSDYAFEVVDWIKYHAAIQPEKIAQIDLGSGRQYTYPQMHDRVSRIAGILQAHGIKKGDRVGFYGLNSTDIMDIVFATWRLGGISLALNFRLTASELEYIVNDAAPDFMFVDDVFRETAEELKKLTSVKNWMSFDGMGGDTEFERAIAAATPVEEMVPLEKTDQCMLMYSSGTTGKPKGVIITHGMMLWSAVNTKGFAELNHDAVALAFMPLFHIGGFNVFAAPIAYCGGTSVIMRIVDVGVVLDTIDDAELGVTHFLGVPAIFNGMRQHPKALTTDYSRIKAAYAGAEAVPVDLVKWWIDHGLIVQEGYGMTETAASTLLLTKDSIPEKLGSAGRPGMHMDIGVFREDGTRADPDEIGELWLRGPTITPGYWNKPEETKESFVNGWFKTGDLARQDADGFFYIEDRVKDMYISGGENVYPAEVENILYELPQIAEVAVIGVPNEQWGEIGCAVIVLKKDATLTLEEIGAHCEGRLAKYKHPAHMVTMSMLPRNATGKVLKFQLRQSVPKELGLG